MPSNLALSKICTPLGAPHEAAQRQRLITNYVSTEKCAFCRQDVARRLPAALLVVFVGIVAALVQYPMVLRALRLGPNIPRIILPTLDEWKHGELLLLPHTLRVLFSAA